MGLFKSAKRAVKKITRPISKVLDKVVPNELKPYLPYLAAVAPVLGPMGAFGSTIGGLTKLQAASLYGLGSLGSQLAQEESEGDFDILPIAMAAGTGYLAAPGTTGMTTMQATEGIPAAQQQKILADRTFLTKAKDLGITGVQGLEKFVQAPQSAKGFLGTTKAIATASSPGVTGQITMDAMKFAKQAELDYLAELDAFNAQAGANQAASDADRRSAIISSMTAANFTQDIIDETLGQLGLKDGGRVGYQTGGQASLQDFRNALQRVGTGTAMDQQRQIKDFARNEIQREMGAAVRGGNFRDFLLQNVGAGGASIYGGLYGSPGNRQGPFTGTYQSMRDSLIDQISRQRMGQQPSIPSPPTDSLTGMLESQMLPNMADGSMKSLAEQNAIRDRVLAAQQAQEESYYLTDPISGKTYKSQDEAIEDLGLVTYNQRFADGGIASFKEGGIARLGFDNGGSIMEGIKAAYGKGMDKSIPKIKKDEDLTRDEIARIKMSVFEVLDQTAGGDKSTLSGGFIDNFGDALEQMARPDLSAYIKDYAQGTGIFSENFIVGGKEDILTKAEGGIARLGFDNGGDVDFGGIKEAIKGIAQNNMEEGVTQMYVSDSAGVIPLKAGDAVTGRTMDMMAMGAIEPYGKNDFRDPDGYERFIDIFTKEQDKNKELNAEGMKKGGLASYKDGGIMNLGGKEMDMRTGGFIPIGAKERADDVPARLSKNEFVMTADAVRAAGGGSVNQGAKRMYDLMHNLEARA